LIDGTFSFLLFGAQILFRPVCLSCPLPTGQPSHTSCLHDAAGGGHLACVKLLVEHGAFLAAEDGNGENAERVAERFGHPAVAAYLKEAQDEVLLVRECFSDCRVSIRCEFGGASVHDKNIVIHQCGNATFSAYNRASPYDLVSVLLFIGVAT
jgi:ankyrin repeat protein